MCLATPFLIVEKRRPSQLVASAIAMTVLGLVMALSIAALQLPFLLHLGLPRGGFETLVRYTAGVSTAVWVLRRAYRYGRDLLYRVDKAADDLQHDPRRSLPLYILRSPGDEATIILTFLQAACLLPDYLLNLIAAGERRSRRWQRRRRRKGQPLIPESWLLGYVAAFTVVTFWGTALYESPPPAWWHVFYVVLAPVAVLVGGAVIILTFMALAGALAIGLMVPMFFHGGIAMAAAALTRRVTVEAAPPGVSTVVQLLTPARARLWRLRHSASHSDLVAVRQTCQVLRGAAAKDAQKV